MHTDAGYHGQALCDLRHCILMHNSYTGCPARFCKRNVKVVFQKDLIADRLNLSVGTPLILRTLNVQIEKDENRCWSRWSRPPIKTLL